jgi:hypothetical protein
MKLSHQFNRDNQTKRSRSIDMKSLKSPSARLAACLFTLALPFLAQAQTVSYTGSPASLAENFDSMGAAGTTTPNGWYVGTNDQPGITVVVASAGGTAANGTVGWNYGTAATAERALGTAATTGGGVGGTGTRFVEVRIVNDTGGDITSFSIQYDGEQWRAGSDTANIDTYVLRYSTDGTTFVNMGGAFNFTSPTRTPVSSALNGNNATNRVADIGSNYTPASPVPNGSVIYLRWFDANGTGTDGGIAVDNFRFSTNLLGVNGVVITSPTNGQQFSDPVSAPVAASVTGASTNVDFYVDGSLFASDATAPYTSVLTGAAVGMHTLVAVAQDAIGGSATSAPVTIEVIANTAPSIVITNPVSGASFFVGDNATVNAVVTDGPGDAHTVQFFDNGVLRFTDTNAPFAVILGDLTAGPHTITATVTDRGGLMASAAAVSINVTNPPNIVTIITNGESWTYLDNGVEQNPLLTLPPDWTLFSFDDMAWSNNFAELGFGDSDNNRPETTVINGGPTNPIITTYFRKKFNVPDPGAFGDLTLRVLRDDAVIVWLNGVEVYRNNFTNTASPLPYTELATAAAGDDGATYQITNVSPGALTIGDNIIAVEVHQSATNSSDLSFDLMLWGVTTFTVAVTTPTNGQQFIEGATVPVTAVANFGALQMDFYVDNVYFASDVDPPAFTTAVSNLTVGTHTVHAVALDAFANTYTSPMVTFEIIANPPSTVAITNPPAGSGFAVGTFVTVGAEATDPQGVARVDFYDNGELRGSDTTSPYSFVLGDLTFGPHSLTAVAVDALGASTVSAPVSITGTNPLGFTSIVTNGAEWKYLDTGVDQGTAWIQPFPVFDDSSWSNGLAELGFGDGPERTVINGGPANDRTRTIYFRKTFTVADPTVFTELRLDLLRDDGGVVYINGVEVFRSNMTNGVGVPVLFTDFAGGATGSETTFVTTNLPRTVLSAGANILAVEVHQNTTNSSDVSFDAMLWGITPAALVVNITTPTNGQSFRQGTPVPVTAVPNFSATNMDFYADGSLVSSDTTAPFNASVTGLVIGPHTLVAVGMDGFGNSVTSAPVSITVFPNTPPTVAITNLLGGETFLVGTFTLVQADATDDGTVARVDFFDNGVLRFADSNAPFAFTLSDLTAGGHSLTAVATDDSGASTPSAPVSINVTNPPGLTAIVTNGCTWKYLDDATDQGTAWRDAGFPDGTWASGPAELGGGDSGAEARPESTVINLGPATNRTPTVYFRKTFSVADPSAFGGLRLDLLRDDGAAVYINGVEVFRSNMTNAPGNPILFTDYAGPAIGGNAEQTYVTTNIAASILGAGATNQLAVELHQNDANSSDLSFDLMLWGTSGCGPAPGMTIEKSGSNVIIRWPLAAVGYSLVFQNVLDPNGPWLPVTNGTDVPDAVNHNVTVPIGDGNQFFLLRCQ